MDYRPTWNWTNLIRPSRTSVWYHVSDAPIQRIGATSDSDAPNIRLVGQSRIRCVEHLTGGTKANRVQSTSMATNTTMPTKPLQRRSPMPEQAFAYSYLFGRRTALHRQHSAWPC